MRTTPLSFAPFPEEVAFPVPGGLARLLAGFAASASPAPVRVAAVRWAVPPVASAPRPARPPLVVTVYGAGITVEGVLPALCFGATTAADLVRSPGRPVAVRVHAFPPMVTFPVAPCAFWPLCPISFGSRDVAIEAFPVLLLVRDLLFFA